MLESTRKTVTPVEWDFIVLHRIQAIGEEWNRLTVDDRFWLVFNWLKEYQIFDPTNPKRQLFMAKSYWQEPFNG